MIFFWKLKKILIPPSNIFSKNYQFFSFSFRFGFGVPRGRGSKVLRVLIRLGSRVVGGLKFLEF